MESVNFTGLKHRVATKEAEDRLFRERVRLALEKILGKQEYLKDLSRNKRVVTLTACNKACAQELYFKKELIEAELGQTIVIR